MFATLGSVLLLRMSAKDFAQLMLSVGRQLFLPTITVTSVLPMAFVMNYCGATGPLGLAFAGSGALFPLAIVSTMARDRPATFVFKIGHAAAPKEDNGRPNSPYWFESEGMSRPCHAFVIVGDRFPIRALAGVAGHSFALVADGIESPL
jgi:hypothetical protein